VLLVLGLMTLAALGFASRLCDLDRKAGAALMLLYAGFVVLVAAG